MKKTQKTKLYIIQNNNLQVQDKQDPKSPQKR